MDRAMKGETEMDNNRQKNNEMSFKNMKESVNNYLIKELEEKLVKKDMLITDLLYLLIDNNVDLIKAGYQDLVEEFGVDFDDKR